jgi:hypothetical protein
MKESVASLLWEGILESFKLARALVMAPIHVISAFLSHRPFDPVQNSTPPNRESGKPSL